MKYLYSDSNKEEGIFLETLLEGIIKDLSEKSELIAEDDCPASINYRSANAEIQELLRKAIRIQIDALNYASVIRTNS